MLENCNDEVAAKEERVTHTREERDRLQLRHNEAGRMFVTTQQELAEARSEITLAQEAETLKDRQLAMLRECHPGPTSSQAKWVQGPTSSPPWQLR